MAVLGRAARGGGAMALLWLVGLTAGCGGARIPLALGPQPTAYADTLPIPEPRRRESIETTHLLDAAVVGQFGRLFSLRRWAGPQYEAVNLTHFDDVVDSSWFERRNGYRRLTEEEVARGPTNGRPMAGGPDLSGPLTVIDAKTEGRTPGFRVRDARGDEFLLKFDPVGFLHLSSAAEVISSRLMYAAGYHTPENTIVVFDGPQLVLDPEVPVPLAGGGGRPMVQVDLVRFLSPLDRLPDGRFLAMASKILPGTGKGPFHFEGRRGDDPNDYYHHEFRRELRGLHVVAAWLNHVDLRFTNTYDAFVEPGYIRHYLIDFGESLGSGTVRPQALRAGRESDFDLGPTLGRLVTLGFYRLPWETATRRLHYPSLGWLPVEDYRPGSWRPKWPNKAYLGMTARDGYWGAKLVAAFTDGQIEAAVSAGQLSDPAAADTLVKMLAFRRDRTVAYWYGRVTPIENVRAERDGTERDGTAASPLVVRFDDLGIRDGVREPATTRYRWEFEHEALGIRSRGEQSAVVAGGARQAIAVAAVDAAGAAGRSTREESFATLTVRVVRDGAAGRPARIHLVWRPDLQGYEVVGLEH